MTESRDDYTLRMKEYERERRLRQRGSATKLVRSLKLPISGPRGLQPAQEQRRRRNNKMLNLCQRLWFSTELVKCKRLYRVM